MKKHAANYISLYKYFAFVLFAVPALASAQALQPIRNLIVAVGSILNILIPVLIAAAIVVFFWGLIQYIRSSGESHEAGRNTMGVKLVNLDAGDKLQAIAPVISKEKEVVEGGEPELSK